MNGLDINTEDGTFAKVDLANQWTQIHPRRAQKGRGQFLKLINLLITIKKQTFSFINFKINYVAVKIQYQRFIATKNCDCILVFKCVGDAARKYNKLFITKNII
jgi:hypothetical protein